VGRKLSFSIVFIIYLLAAAVGIGTYLLVSGAVWLKLLMADVVATVFTFICSIAFKNASVYDPYWSVQPLVILFAFVKNITLSGALILLAVTLWGVRLTANWAYTFHGLKHQDWRYTMLKEKTGKWYPVINFIGIHMVPTLVVYAVTLPAVYVLLARVSFAPWAITGLLLSVGATALQGTADIQMHRYRKNKTTPFIRVGLWKYSRHPNYLGEITMWWGVGLYAVLTLGFRWYFLIGAVANTVLFFAVSIPMADGRQSKKEGYQEYKAQTRMLLPIPKKGGK